jgi:uncharacterized protein with NRDE domain
MCVLALGWQAHPRWQLVVAGNRDEFHARPATPLARWESPDHIIAGRDLEAGGTWLGISERGRFAVVTNLRGSHAPPPQPASRGALVTDLLTGGGDRSDPDTVDLRQFRPFNLILTSQDGARFLSNEPQPLRKSLASGVYGLSNGALDEPWPKTVQLKSALSNWLTRDLDDPSFLFDVLARDTLSGESPAHTAATEGSFEPWKSPIFIRHPVYGTRCSTVVLVDRAGEGRIIERRFSTDGQPVGETVLNFRWPLPGRDR